MFRLSWVSLMTTRCNIRCPFGHNAQLARMAGMWLYLSLWAPCLWSDQIEYTVQFLSATPLASQASCAKVTHSICVLDSSLQSRFFLVLVTYHNIYPRKNKTQLYFNIYTSSQESLFGRGNQEIKADKWLPICFRIQFTESQYTAYSMQC